MTNSRGTQILTLTGLRFAAKLGILDEEKKPAPNRSRSTPS